MVNKSVVILAIVLFTDDVTFGVGDREFGDQCEPQKQLELRNQYDQSYSQGQQYRPYGHDRSAYSDQGSNNPRSHHFYPRPEHHPSTHDNVESQYAQRLREVNETRRCRSERGLRCDPYTRTCKCFDLAGAAWSHERERCEFTFLGTFCSAKITEFAQYCTEYAQCTCNWQHWDERRWYACDSPPVMDHQPFLGEHDHDTNNGKCLCQPGYRPRSNNMDCWYSSAGIKSPSILVSVSLLSLKTWSVAISP